MKGFELTGNDIYEDVVDYSKKGALKGVFLGFPAIDPHYTMSLPGVTDWTGFPQSGKTQVLMEFLLFTSVHYGWKHLVYFPDVGTPTEIICDLIHKLTGKTFDKRYENIITESEVAKWIPWVIEHFKILTKKDLKAKLTPYQFWDYCAELNKETDGGIQTGSIDSWKDMYHDTTKFGRDDKYLEDVLSYRNAMAEKHTQHYHTIIHPLKTKEDKDGNRKPPGPYDLKGGSEWYNNAKCQVTVHRPAGSKNEVEIHWNKIKPRSIGKVGLSKLLFDPTLFRYYWYDMEEKVYAEKQGRIPKKQEVQQLSMGMDDENDDDDLPF